MLNLKKHEIEAFKRSLTLNWPRRKLAKYSQVVDKSLNPFRRHFFIESYRYLISRSRTRERAASRFRTPIYTCRACRVHGTPLICRSTLARVAASSRPRCSRRAVCAAAAASFATTLDTRRCSPSTLCTARCPMASPSPSPSSSPTASVKADSRA